MYKLLKYDFVWMNYYSAALLFSSQCSTELFNRYFLEHWAIELLSQNISILEKIAKKWKITNFSLEPLYDWIWSKCHQLTCFHTFLCIYDEYLRKKLKIFHFHFFFAFCHFLGFWQYVTYDYQIWENSWFFGPNGFWQFH